jgi:AraC-like DNA-binding protein
MPWNRIIFGISGRRYHQYQKNGEVIARALEADDVLLVPPGAGLSIGYKGPCRSVQVNMSAGMAVYKYNDIGSQYDGSAGLFYDHVCQNPLRLPYAKDFAGRQICSVLFQQYSRASKSYCQNLLECLLDDLQQLLAVERNDTSIGYCVWSRICEYIDENYTYTISRSEAAKKFNLHPNHISRLFKKFGRRSFNERLNQRRLEHAMEQLTRNLELTIAEIAYNSGFNTVEHFNRRFRAAIGKTPGEWRRANMSSRKQARH